MPSTGIEPATLRLLTRRCNQLSYASVQNYYYLLYKQTLFGKSIHNRQLSLRTCIKYVATVFKKSTAKFSIFYFKIAKRRSADGCSAPWTLVFLYCSNTALLKKYPPSKLHVFKWIYQAVWSALLFLHKNPGSLKISILDLQMRFVLS